VFSGKNFVRTFAYPRLLHEKRNVLGFITLKILGELKELRSSSLYNPLHSPVPSSLLGPNILLWTFFSETATIYICSSVRVREKVSNPSK